MLSQPVAHLLADDPAEQPRLRSRFGEKFGRVGGQPREIFEGVVGVGWSGLVRANTGRSGGGDDMARSVGVGEVRVSIAEYGQCHLASASGISVAAVMVQYPEALLNGCCQGMRGDRGDDVGKDVCGDQNGDRRVYVGYRMPPLRHDLRAVDFGEQT